MARADEANNNSGRQLYYKNYQTIVGAPSLASHQRQRPATSPQSPRTINFSHSHHPFACSPDHLHHLPSSPLLLLDDESDGDLTLTAERTDALLPPSQAAAPPSPSRLLNPLGTRGSTLQPVVAEHHQLSTSRRLCASNSRQSLLRRPGTANVSDLASLLRDTGRSPMAPRGKEATKASRRMTIGSKVALPTLQMETIVEYRHPPRPARPADTHTPRSPSPVGHPSPILANHPYRYRQASSPPATRCYSFSRALPIAEPSPPLRPPSSPPPPITAHLSYNDTSQAQSGSIAVSDSRRCSSGARPRRANTTIRKSNSLWLRPGREGRTAPGGEAISKSPARGEVQSPLRLLIRSLDQKHQQLSTSEDKLKCTSRGSSSASPPALQGREAVPLAADGPSPSASHLTQADTGPSHLGMTPKMTVRRKPRPTKSSNEKSSHGGVPAQLSQPPPTRQRVRSGSASILSFESSSSSSSSASSSSSSLSSDWTWASFTASGPPQTDYQTTTTMTTNSRARLNSRRRTKTITRGPDTAPSTIFNCLVPRPDVDPHPEQQPPAAMPLRRPRHTFRSTQLAATDKNYSSPPTQSSDPRRPGSTDTDPTCLPLASSSSSSSVDQASRSTRAISSWTTNKMRKTSGFFKRKFSPSPALAPSLPLPSDRFNSPRASISSSHHSIIGRTPPETSNESEPELVRSQSSDRPPWGATAEHPPPAQPRSHPDSKPSEATWPGPLELLPLAGQPHGARRSDEPQLTEHDHDDNDDDGEQEVTTGSCGSGVSSNVADGVPLPLLDDEPDERSSVCSSSGSIRTSSTIDSCSISYDPSCRALTGGDPTTSSFSSHTLVQQPSSPARPVRPSLPSLDPSSSSPPCPPSSPPCPPSSPSTSDEHHNSPVVRQPPSAFRQPLFNRHPLTSSASGIRRVRSVDQPLPSLLDRPAPSPLPPTQTPSQPLPPLFPFSLLSRQSASNLRQPYFVPSSSPLTHRQRIHRTISSADLTLAARMSSSAAQSAVLSPPLAPHSANPTPFLSSMSSLTTTTTNSILASPLMPHPGESLPPSVGSDHSVHLQTAMSEEDKLRLSLERWQIDQDGVLSGGRLSPTPPTPVLSSTGRHHRSSAQSLALSPLNCLPPGSVASDPGHSKQSSSSSSPSTDSWPPAILSNLSQASFDVRQHSSPSSVHHNHQTSAYSYSRSPSQSTTNSFFSTHSDLSYPTRSHSSHLPSTHSVSLEHIRQTPVSQWPNLTLMTSPPPHSKSPPSLSAPSPLVGSPSSIPSLLNPDRLTLTSRSFSTHDLPGGSAPFLRRSKGPEPSLTKSTPNRGSTTTSSLTSSNSLSSPKFSPLPFHLSRSHPKLPSSSVAVHATSISYSPHLGSVHVNPSCLPSRSNSIKGPVGSSRSTLLPGLRSRSHTNDSSSASSLKTLNNYSPTLFAGSSTLPTSSQTESLPPVNLSSPPPSVGSSPMTQSPGTSRSNTSTHTPHITSPMPDHDRPEAQSWLTPSIRLVSPTSPLSSPTADLVRPRSNSHNTPSSSPSFSQPNTPLRSSSPSSSRHQLDEISQDSLPHFIRASSRSPSGRLTGTTDLPILPSDSRSASITVRSDAALLAKTGLGLNFHPPVEAATQFGCPPIAPIQSPVAPKPLRSPSVRKIQPLRRHDSDQSDQLTMSTSRSGSHDMAATPDMTGRNHRLLSSSSPSATPVISSKPSLCSSDLLKVASERKSLETLSMESFVDSRLSLTENAKRIADIIWMDDGKFRIKRENLTEWFGSRPTNSDESLPGLEQMALREYMNKFDFRKMRVDDGMRAMCKKLYLKGETQQVDRILVEFSNRFWEQNRSHVYFDPDMVHALSYSILLLNTDLHVVDTNSRMSRSQFVRNTLETIHVQLSQFETYRAALLSRESPTLDSNASSPLISEQDGGSLLHKLEHRKRTRRNSFADALNKPNINEVGHDQQAQQPIRKMIGVKTLNIPLVNRRPSLDRWKETLSGPPPAVVMQPERQLSRASSDLRQDEVLASRISSEESLDAHRLRVATQPLPSVSQIPGLSSPHFLQLNQTLLNPSAPSTNTPDLSRPLSPIGDLRQSCGGSLKTHPPLPDEPVLKDLWALKFSRSQFDKEIEGLLKEIYSSIKAWPIFQNPNKSSGGINNLGSSFPQRISSRKSQHMLLGERGVGGGVGVGPGAYKRSSLRGLGGLLATGGHANVGASDLGSLSGHSSLGRSTSPTLSGGSASMSVSSLPSNAAGYASTVGSHTFTNLTSPSVGFVSNLSQSIIREQKEEDSTDLEVSGEAHANIGVAEENVSAQSNKRLKEAAKLAEDELALLGPPWAKEGLLQRKQYWDSNGKRFKDKTWSEVFVVIQQGTLRMFKFGETSSSKQISNMNSEGITVKASGVGGGNWLPNAQSCGEISLTHGLSSALPSGYNKSRPHAFVMTLADGSSYFFQTGTDELVNEWVSTCNYWSARLSKEPLTGGVSNMDYGWSLVAEIEDKMREVRNKRRNGSNLEAWTASVPEKLVGAKKVLRKDKKGNKYLGDSTVGTGRGKATEEYDERMSIISANSQKSRKLRSKWFGTTISSIPGGGSSGAFNYPLPTPPNTAAFLAADLMGSTMKLNTPIKKEEILLEEGIEQVIAEIKKKRNGGQIVFNLHDWTPPGTPKVISNLSEIEQLDCLKRHVEHLRQQLEDHNRLRKPMIELYSNHRLMNMILDVHPGMGQMMHNNLEKSQTNWERKSRYLLTENIKYSTYCERLEKSITQKIQIINQRKGINNEGDKDNEESESVYDEEEEEDEDGDEDEEGDQTDRETVETIE